MRTSNLANIAFFTLTIFEGISEQNYGSIILTEDDVTEEGVRLQNGWAL
jgi:hypothetical protein